MTSGPLRTPVLYTVRSDPQIPQALTRSLTWPSDGSGTGASLTVSERIPSKTAGPGLANAFAGLAEANAAGVPVVVLSGRTGFNQRGRGAVQDLEQLAAVTAVTKWRAECPSTARIPWFVAEAVHQARAGAPGVAYLEIPQDVLAATAEPETRPWPTGHGPEPARSVPVATDVERAVSLLANASRPVALAGSGAFFSQAGGAVAAFADRTGIPVVT